MADNNKNTVVYRLCGKIDSGNAPQIEQEIFTALAGRGDVLPVLDAEALEYISSAGLRIILRLKKSCGDVKITNANSDIYEILEMTGFTEIMQVEKAYRKVSVEGCDVVGEGQNGKVYRVDRDNVVKVYKNADALEDIKHEREMAKLALILGIPTAISYDVVKVGESYGSMFELLDARSFSNILAKEPERIDECVYEYVKILKKLHSTHVPEGKLPRLKERVVKAASYTKDQLPEGLGDKLMRMIEAIPETDTLIHGDCHTKNIVMTGEEVMLIDMDTLSVGHPIFEFMRMYNSYIGYSEYDPQVLEDFQGYPAETARVFWKKTLCAYFGTDDEDVINSIEEKIRCVSYAYLIDWSRRHKAAETERGRLTCELWKKRITELIPRLDSLDFEVNEATRDDPNELTLEAEKDNLTRVLEFLDRRLESCDLPPKAQMQLDLAVEEIFINIASYAYSPNKGKATVRVEVTGDPVTVTITFIDRGVPYDPLKKTDPDVTLSADDREIGGLGIFLAKKIMDDISYEYKNGQNILRLKKKI
ncbi:MAG: ATP-binding protein [Clostridia bacterium]|nr:ATP-binding protein [Clostridia bacterium]